MIAGSELWLEASGIGLGGTPKFVVEKYLPFMYEGDARIECAGSGKRCETSAVLRGQRHNLHDVAVLKSIPTLAPDGTLSVVGTRVEFTPERC